LLNKERPDIIHFGHTMYVAEFVTAAISIGIPYVMTLTDFFLLCPKVNLTTTHNSLCNGPENGKACALYCQELDSNFTLNRLHYAKEYILKNAHRIFVPSRFIAEAFKLELPDISVKVIGHGISSSIFKPHVSPKSTLTFMYAGSFNPYKGVHLLLDAFSRIKGSNISLKVYGSGVDEVYTKKIMDMIAKDERVEYCGVYSDEQMDTVFSLADLLVIPSICYESYSFVLHEAFSRGVPVVVSNLGALGEKVLHAYNGLIFDPYTCDALLNAIQLIVDNPVLLDEMKANVITSMITTVEQEAHAYEREYLSVLSQFTLNPCTTHSS
jgi:glycosyltransferase involved in cell wall biosynthesis